MTTFNNQLRNFPMLVENAGKYCTAQIRLRDGSMVVFDTITEGSVIVIGFDKPLEFIRLYCQATQDTVVVTKVFRKNRHGFSYKFDTQKAVNLQLRMLEARLRGSQTLIKFGCW